MMTAQGGKASGTFGKVEYATESNLFRFCARHVYHPYTCWDFYVRSRFDYAKK